MCASKRYNLTYEKTNLKKIIIENRQTFRKIKIYFEIIFSSHKSITILNIY